MPSTAVYLVLPVSIARDRRPLDVVRRVEVGLAGAEADDVAAGGLQRARLVVTAIVGEGLIRSRVAARKDMAGSIVARRFGCPPVSLRRRNYPARAYRPQRARRA